MVEPDTHMVVAYVTGQMREPAEDTRFMEIIMAAYDGSRCRPVVSTASAKAAKDSWS